MSYTPTAEQQAVYDAVTTGRNLVIQARAGAGKTSTLRGIADRLPNRRIVYTAFNKAIVDDVKANMPTNVLASTSHGLANRQFAGPFRHRLNRSGPRLTRYEQAKFLAITPFYYTLDSRPKVLQPKQCSGLVLKALKRFCQTADPEPSVQHFPFVDGLDLEGYANQNALRRHLLPALRKAWADANDPQGRLPYEHGNYLKLAQLKGIDLGADLVMVDEAQDLSPVLLDIVMQQQERGAQIVLVGDSEQSIYGFTGAIDALTRVQEHPRRTTDFDVLYLTQSFRFGPAIADVANLILGRLDATPLRGLDTVTSSVSYEATTDATAVLCRTNATAVREFTRQRNDGKRVLLLGNIAEIVSFAQEALALKEGKPAWADLSAFSTWQEVQDYVDHDPEGEELRVKFQLVEDHGADELIEMLSVRMPKADQADVVVATAHKTKGLQFPRVRLAGDFAPSKRADAPRDPREDNRLLYVAVTRAQFVLDVSAVASLHPEPVAVEEYATIAVAVDNAESCGKCGDKLYPITVTEDGALVMRCDRCHNADSPAPWVYTPDQQAILDNPRVPGYVQPPWGPGTPYEHPQDVPFQSPWERVVRSDTYGPL